MQVAYSLAAVFILAYSAHALPWLQLKALKGPSGGQGSRLGHHDVAQRWHDFKMKYGKKYSTLTAELRRYATFKNNFKFILDHNAKANQGESAFVLGINEYTDMDGNEFVRTMNGFRRSNRTKMGATYFSPTLARLPPQVDWRNSGLVTPIKNQGQCGSCWAFSATGALEGQTFKKTGGLTSLSEQNLVDCSGKWGNRGCNGGEMDNAFTYIQDNGGIDTEEAYPYEAQENDCRCFQSESTGATDAGYVDIPEGDEEKLKEAVATVGPISVAIDASQASFQHYSHGIYDEKRCRPEDLDHGVLVVGYGTEAAGDYWLVKNSWGTTWGSDGYIKMSRNKDNQCGIASTASYPLV